MEGLRLCIAEMHEKPKSLMANSVTIGAVMGVTTTLVILVEGYLRGIMSELANMGLTSSRSGVYSC